MLKLIVISDSTGETCEQIVRAAFAQFDIEEREIERHSNVRNVEVLNKITDKIDNFDKTIETINEGIKNSVENSSIDGLVLLNYVKFVTMFRNNKNYEDSLKSIKVFTEYTKESNLSKSVLRKVDTILK